ncbi:MAG: tetratricopeptide repeat protein [Gemmatimonadota bacterium]|nr:tetratricopeptide repeat protein [Gemmatimonadota bacterium]
MRNRCLDVTTIGRSTRRFSRPARCLMVVAILAACAEPAADGTADAGGGVATQPPAPAAATVDLPEGVQAISLLGDTLRASVSAEAESRLVADLVAAEAEYEADPQDADALIWYGRRLGYLQEYREAIRIFSEGIALHPDDARMYRHRGHRYISTRQLDASLADFRRAAELIEGTPDEVEPDGAPNALGIPTSTLQSNIWYHYGLTQYLMGDFEAAIDSYEAYLDVTTNPDQLVAISHWYYMALRRLGRDDEAAAILEPIHADLEVIENGSYHDLLLMYRGEIEADELWGGQDDPLGSATVGYGVANWHFYNGRTDQAIEAFERVLDTGQWASFGYIAAEAELARLGRGGG